MGIGAGIAGDVFRVEVELVENIRAQEQFRFGKKKVASNEKQRGREGKREVLVF